MLHHFSIFTTSDRQEAKMVAWYWIPISWIGFLFLQFGLGWFAMRNTKSDKQIEEEPKYFGPTGTTPSALDWYQPNPVVHKKFGKLRKGSK